MTPHVSGTSLSAQTRYAAGTREILECWFVKKPIRNEYLIVKDGKLAGAGAHSYSPGNATKGSEEAAKFKAKAAVNVVVKARGKPSGVKVKTVTRATASAKSRK